METVAEEISGSEKCIAISVGERADQIVKDYVLYSMGTGFLPIPIVDIFGLIGLQVKMVHSLSKVYNVPFSESKTRTILYSLAGSILPVAGVGLLASAVKVIPFVGQTAGAFSMSALAGGFTYAVGRIFVNHFEKSGNIDNLNVEEAKEDLKENMETSKSAARKINTEK